VLKNLEQALYAHMNAIKKLQKKQKQTNKKN
jgi:hypothetical protein